MGRFLPHPDDVPVELTLRKHSCISRQRLHTISLGGMACNYHRAWRRGTALEVRMPSLGEHICYHGYVAWCLRRKHGYLVGIAFVDEQTLFGARMGEQVFQIERYCRMHEPKAEQQQMQALALEWVQQHAEDFSHEQVRQAFVQP
ncbi:PilZ domain-containing protein [Pseudomonas sp. MAFF 302030]|uniref:PilZ domain-containing protein n=1 Tax=Pseudomonas morbosilactucae TaxID=2938197 RepID=A0A9X1YY10_9PSED|nr:PilZ domain-containing protein [Pseudomonas morbosilactucae]MCK9800202.1 PilZ domain-containing protein [Pseudomonas morbosilactucae]